MRKPLRLLLIALSLAVVVLSIPLILLTITTHPGNTLAENIAFGVMVFAACLWPASGFIALRSMKSGGNPSWTVLGRAISLLLGPAIIFYVAGNFHGFW